MKKFLTLILFTSLLSSLQGQTFCVDMNGSGITINTAVFIKMLIVIIYFMWTNLVRQKAFQ